MVTPYFMCCSVFFENCFAFLYYFLILQFHGEMQNIVIQFIFLVMNAIYLIFFSETPIIDTVKCQYRNYNRNLRVDP